MTEWADMTAGPAIWALCFAAGMAIGAVYLGLLWAAVRALNGARPAVLFITLAAARALLVLGALAGAIALGAGAGQILAALVGFIAVRVAATRRAGAAERGGAWK
ncbi:MULTISPECIES: ATP synthase subunit I [Sediminimonas]|uniref:N-ATPase subunit AtpR n=1 Tax=Sediminimonas TaxID=659427 RepID=UPI000419F006|nr:MULTISPECIES: ATP synthase subunit I [Sediminimonas]MDR9486077.1 ATP synthase subunit I [Sediminimonas sp.]